MSYGPDTAVGYPHFQMLVTEDATGTTVTISADTGDMVNPPSDMNPFFQSLLDYLSAMEGVTVSDAIRSTRYDSEVTPTL